MANSGDVDSLILVSVVRHARPRVTFSTDVDDAARGWLVGRRGAGGGRVLVREAAPQIRTHHLHVVALGGDQWDR